MDAIFYIVNVEVALVRDGRFLMIVRGAAEDHAAGTLSMPGGKVETTSATDDMLEATARREVLEEVGLLVENTMHYIESNVFLVGDVPVLDLVLLCHARAGTPQIADPGEVAAMHWLTAAQVAEHPLALPWTRRSIALAEQQRQVCGW